MARCFVIQPFDQGKFERRYDETFAPAISHAALEPYRVDRDPGVNDLLEGIENGIRDSVAVLADITTDNANVWYELGCAMAARKPFCICCSEERTSAFPFDVSHLKIIKYNTGSLSDYSRLGEKITERLKAVVSRDADLRSFAITPLSKTDGLAPYELAGLTILFGYQYESEPGISAYGLNSDMEKAGFTKAATNLAIADLLDRGFITKSQNLDDRGEPYTVFILTPDGVKWIRQNKGQLVLRREVRSVSGPITDEDIPF